MSTNIPPPSLEATGYVLPADSDILAGACSDVQNAFGNILVLDPNNTATLSTPQGQLASSLAAIVSDCDAQFLGIVSQVDPQYAQGRMQDAIGNLFGQQREIATPTVVNTIVHGDEGTIIPASPTITAQDAAGNNYTCPGVTIPAGGTASLTFTAVVPGAIPFSTPMTIYQSVAGWSGITNAVQTVLGDNLENAQAFEARRQATISVNSNGMIASIRAAILSIQGFDLACAIAENDTAISATINGVMVAANSIYISVAEIGSPHAVQLNTNGIGDLIARAILSKKSPGCNYATSALTFLEYDTSYPEPQPSYTVGLSEATATPINFQVTLAAATNPPSDAITLITTAIQNAFAGEDGQTAVGSQIGYTVYSSRFYSGIAAALPGVAILGVQLGTGTPSGYSQSLTLDQIPTLGTVALELS